MLSHFDPVVIPITPIVIPITPNVIPITPRLSFRAKRGICCSLGPRRSLPAFFGVPIGLSAFSAS
jgi:hypothetical protein